jgi:hypothetical protein
MRLSSLGTAATNWPIVPALDDRWWVWSSRWSETWQGKPKYSEKTSPRATLSNTNPTWPDLGLNPGPRGGKMTNRLSYDIAKFSLRVTLWIEAYIWKVSFINSSRIPAVLSEGFCDIPHSFQANPRILFWIGYCRNFPNSFQFFILLTHYNYTYMHYLLRTLYSNTSLLNKIKCGPENYISVYPATWFHELLFTA